MHVTVVLGTELQRLSDVGGKGLPRHPCFILLWAGCGFASPEVRRRLHFTIMALRIAYLGLRLDLQPHPLADARVCTFHSLTSPSVSHRPGPAEVQIRENRGP